MLDDGIPRWLGKQLHNELVKMPYGEKRRISQILTEKTKRTALKECQVTGNHEGKIVEGHSIQEAVIRELTPNHEVFTFNDIPLAINRFRHFPHKISFRHALTGYFTCEEHEKLFFDVENHQPDFTNEWHLDLLAYKALIRVLWETKLVKGAWSAVAVEDDKSDMPDFQLKLFTDMERALSQMKQAVEAKMGLTDNPSAPRTLSNVLTHHVVRVPSKVKSLAISTWSNGLARRAFLTPYGPGTEIIPQWGCTVYPLEREHVVIFHYFAHNQRAFSRQMARVRTAESTAILQRRITQILLGRFEDVVIAPTVWESFPERRWTAIRDYFMATMPNVGLDFPGPKGKPVEKWDRRRRRLINLFVN